MSIRFEELRRHAEDDRLSPIWAIIILVVFSLLIFWLFFAQVVIYKSGDGYIQSKAPLHILAFGKPGYLKEVSVSLGQRVNKGDLIARLDRPDISQHIASLTAQASLYRQQLAVADKEMDLARVRAASSQETLSEQLKSLEQQQAIQQSQIENQKKLLKQLESLTFKGGSSKSKILREKLLINKEFLQKERLLEQKILLTAEIKQAEEELTAELTRIDRQTIKTQSTLEEVKQQLSAALQASSEVKLYASQDSRVANIKSLRPGSWVNAGERIATLMPGKNNDLEAVITIDSKDALGHLREGQQANLHLKGFPWTQYGKVASRVSNIEKVKNQHHVTVYLKLDELALNDKIKLQHDMPLTAYIAVSQKSPWQLMLASLGHGVMR
mgnify:CR=1 FL=1